MERDCGRVRGFCDNYQGLQIAWKDQKAGESYFIEAYTHYMAAAEHLPLDDERRICKVFFIRACPH
jgi:hypothetical protein